MRPTGRTYQPPITPQSRLQSLITQTKAAAEAKAARMLREDSRQHCMRATAEHLQSYLSAADGLPTGEHTVVRVRVCSPEAGRWSVLVVNEERGSSHGIQPQILAEVTVCANEDGTLVWLEMDGQKAPRDAVDDVVVGRVEAAFDARWARPGDPQEEIPF